jgi:quercetin dioxygenase-like cupin family protein
MVTYLYLYLKYTIINYKKKGAFKMLEKVYNFSTTEDIKKIEKIIDDEPVMINHMVLPKGTGLPEHYSNSNVYMIIIRGNMTLKLNEQEPQQYSYGRIINIPYNTKMDVNNFDEDILEFFVVKSPNPRNYKE